jgi:hypothetical protein
MAPPEITFTEIKNGKRFEELAASYFRKLKEEDNDIVEVKVEPSGEGVDGGRDIFVTFRINDSLSTFERKWVIQCKFLKRSVSAKDIASVNVPSLIHQYNAEGYLLICRHTPTSGLTNMLEELNRKCKFKYQYMFWSGTDFVERLYNCPSLQQTFFPKYFRQMKNKKIPKL